MGFPGQNLPTELATKGFKKKKLHPIISLCFPGLESIFNLKKMIKQKSKEKTLTIFMLWSTCSFKLNNVSFFKKLGNLCL